MSDDLVRQLRAFAAGCRGSNEMCGCQNGPHPVRQDPEAEITALRARLEAVEKERDNETIKRASWELEAKTAQAALATARRDAYERAAQVAETAKAVCARCNSPEDNHPYRHLFIPVVMINIPAAIRALADEAPE